MSLSAYNLTAYNSDSRLNIPRAKGPRLSTQTVITPIASLHRKASRRSGQETQLLYGHHFDVYEVKKGWVWGQAKSPIKGSKQKGYVGYVPSRFLEAQKTRASHIVTALNAPMFSNADIKSHIVQVISYRLGLRPMIRHLRMQKMHLMKTLQLLRTPKNALILKALGMHRFVV